MSTETLPTKTEADFVVSSRENSIFFSNEAFERAQRVAVMLSKSTLVPDYYRSNIADCIILLEMANRLKLSPIFLSQRVKVINGKPGLEGKLVTALINESGIFQDDLEFVFSGTGDELKCTARAVRKSSGKVCESEVSVKMAKDMGWWKQNPKWTQMTNQMLIYRSASFFGNAHCPSVLFGLHTVDELEDISSPQSKVVVDQVSSLNERVSQSEREVS